MNAIEQSKRLAAYNAVDHHVMPHDRVGSFYTHLNIRISIFCFRSLELVLVRIIVSPAFVES